MLLRVLVLILLSALLCVPRMLPAQETVFYRCTDAQGNVSMQNGTPCAPGMQQEIRRIGAVKTTPVPARKPAVPPPLPPVPQYGEFVLVSGPTMQRTPAPAAAGLPAPPPLYQCTTWQGDTYFGETANPEPRCVPLQVVGIDGTSALGMGQACEMKQDHCEAVPAAQLCAAWYRRLDEADFKLRYAAADSRRQRQDAFDAIAAQIKTSHCSTTPPDKPATPAGTP